MHVTVTFDAADHVALADWWAETLGWIRRFAGEDMAIIVPKGVPEEDERHMLFMRVPEAKVAKNRVHLDLHPDGDTRAYIAGLVERGATLVEQRGEGWPVHWATLTDPEGNEFCVVIGRSE